MVQRIDPPVYHGEAAKRRRGPGRMWPTRHVRGRGRSSARRSRVRSRRPAATAHPIPHGSGIPHSVVSHTAVVSHTISRIGGGLLSNARMFCFSPFCSRPPAHPADPLLLSGAPAGRRRPTGSPVWPCRRAASSPRRCAEAVENKEPHTAETVKAPTGIGRDGTARERPRTNHQASKQTNKRSTEVHPPAQAHAARPSLVTASTAHLRQTSPAGT